MPEYTLKPVTEIPSSSRRLSSLYADILDSFVSSDAKLAEVEVENRKPSTVYQGLTKAKKATNAPVAVIQRAHRIFLSKE